MSNTSFDRPATTMRRRDDRGAAMVEFALVMPLLVTFLLGAFTTGLAINDGLQLTHSAREGARYGASIPEDEVFSSGTWAENVRTLVIERFGDGLATSDVCVSLVIGSSPGVPLSSAHTTKSDGTACYDDSAAGMIDLRVQVAASKPAAIYTAFYTHDMTLSSEAIAKHESNG
jgi:Flp pilus assembly pilin Flp